MKDNAASVHLRWRLPKEELGHEKPFHEQAFYWASLEKPKTQGEIDSFAGFLSSSYYFFASPYSYRSRKRTMGNQRYSISSLTRLQNPTEMFRLSKEKKFRSTLAVDTRTSIQSILEGLKKMWIPVPSVLARERSSIDSNDQLRQCAVSISWSKTYQILTLDLRRFTWQQQWLECIIIQLRSHRWNDTMAIPQLIRLMWKKVKSCIQWLTSAPQYATRTVCQKMNLSFSVISSQQSCEIWKPKNFVGNSNKLFKNAHSIWR